MVDVDFYKSEYFNNTYVIVYLLSLTVMIFSIFFYNMIRKMDRDLFPAHTRYVAIQRIKVKNNK
jgi:putative effector of murein hydrolase